MPSEIFLFVLFSIAIVGAFTFLYVRRNRLSAVDIVLARIASVELFLFALIAYCVSMKGSVSDLDHSITEWIFSMQSASWDSTMSFMSWLFNASQFFLFSLLFLAALLFMGRFKESAFSSAALLAAYLSDTYAKNFFQIARPFGSQASGWGFPSGHTTMAAAFFLVLFLALTRRIKHGAVWGAILLLSVAGTLLVGTSRIYLGVHWFSDVLGGLLLGTFWVFLSLAVAHAATPIRMVKKVRRSR